MGDIDGDGFRIAIPLQLWGRHRSMHRRDTTLHITTLTFLGFYLNGAMDSGRYDDLEIDEVRQEIEAGTIFPFLKARLGTDIDLSILQPADQAELVAEWQDLLLAVDERRKLGVKRRGLTLLVAYLLEGIQRRI
jgi:hypothetical protein